MILLLAVAAALACDPVAPQVAAAHAAFDDAELGAARAALDRAYASLACQERVVETADLLALYRLDGVVSLASGDPQRAVWAVLRAVAADHVTGISAEEEGPELYATYRTWQARLAPTLVSVTVAGPGTVWVDGRPARAHQPLRVAQGEHLVQEEGPAGLTSRVIELSHDWVAGAAPGAAPPPGLPAPVAAAPLPIPAPAAPAPPAPVSRTARRDVPSTVTWITGLALGAAGGAALGWAAWQEEQFLADPPTAPTDGARVDAVRAEASRIRWTYLGGYGLAGVGGGLFVGGVAGAAVHTRF